MRKGPRSEGGNGLGWAGRSLLQPVLVPGAGDRGHGALLQLLSSTGGDFKSFPGHQWHLYPRSLSMELPAGPKQLSPGMPILPLAFLWAPALGFPTWEQFPTRMFYPLLYEQLKPKLFSLHSRVRTGWFIPQRINDAKTNSVVSPVHLLWIKGSQ